LGGLKCKSIAGVTVVLTESRVLRIIQRGLSYCVYIEFWESPLLEVLLYTKGLVQITQCVICMAGDDVDLRIHHMPSGG
jgi:hypothetical protein